MLKRKPLHPTNLTPEEIIGNPNDVGFLESHYVQSRNIHDPEKYEKIMQDKFSDEERRHAINLYAKLRDHGYYPDGIDSKNNIIWGTNIIGEMQQYIESKYPLKCDRCSCVDGVCEGYTDEQIEYFKSLARKQLPISQWPDKIFNRG